MFSRMVRLEHHVQLCDCIWYLLYQIIGNGTLSKKCNFLKFAIKINIKMQSKCNTNNCFLIGKYKNCGVWVLWLSVCWLITFNENGMIVFNRL